MDALMAAGFAAVAASLAAVLILVLVSRRIIERTRRRNLKDQAEAGCRGEPR